MLFGLPWFETILPARNGCFGSLARTARVRGATFPRVLPVTNVAMPAT
jgi:hypothetical protein